MDPTAAPSDLTDELLAHLVQMATLAPSLHNSQPWRFVPQADGVRVLRDRSRALTATDPDGRELLISCGAAVHHLTVAARAASLYCRVEPLVGDADPDAVAHVHLAPGPPPDEEEQRTAEAVLHRHTQRGRFEDRPVPPEVLDRLRTAAEAQGGLLRVVRDDELVEVEVLVSRAEQALLSDPDYARELREWVWGEADAADRTDGLPAGAVAHGDGRAESLQGRLFGGAALPRPDEPPVPEHPTVVLLGTLGDLPADWLQAGQALSALLLQATREGLNAQPIGQVVDVPASRWALRARLATVGAPQALLRLGYGAAAAATPRRAVADVLDDRRTGTGW